MLLLTLVLFACRGSETATTSVVLMIGDGLGFSQLALSRIATAGTGGRLKVESMPTVGIVTTYSASNAVTDSGAAATAFAGGVKTDNRYIGLDAELGPVTTLGELAQKAGWRVGYVTTTRITHATPACFYAHYRDRYDEEGIAPQLLTSGVDVALGGGLSLFLPPSEGGVRRDDRNLVNEAIAAGYRVLERGDALEWNGEGKLLGLFANSHLAYQLDDRNYPVERQDPSLAALSRLALDGLSAKREPFFVMIEGGRIDHAGHEFDAAGVVAETQAFDEAVAAVLSWRERHPGTLVLLTADHATGGLAINDFSRFDMLSRRTASVAYLVDQIRNAGAGRELVAERSGVGLTAAEIESVRAAPTAYEANRRLGSAFAERDGFTWLPRVDESETKGHTGEDVPLFAEGPGAGRFAGVLDNTDIPKRLAALLGWNLPTRAPEGGVR